jgi:hypothetical protein
MPPGPSWLGVERIHQSSLAVLMGLAAMVIGVAKVLAPAVRRRLRVATGALGRSTARPVTERARPLTTPEAVTEKEVPAPG